MTTSIAIPSPSLPSLPSPATTAAATGTTASSGSGSALSTLSGNFNDFLSLLMTQLKNQDPTSPTDTNRFTTELVQFTGVQQQINTNSSLTSLIQLTQGGEVLQASSIVGKPVQVTSDHLALQNGTGGVAFTTAASEPVSIGVYNDSGTQLRSATVTSAAGANTWTWDGKNDQGQQLADGSYKVVVTTPDASGTAQAVPFTVSGTATGVERNGTALTVQMGALGVDLSAVQSVQGGT